MKYSRLLFVGGGMLASVFAAFSAKKSDKPNIVFILCDDMGYGDLGCYGQKYIETPNIDRMASEGMRFTQAYSGSPVSAPSRGCIMTGQHTGCRTSSSRFSAARTSIVSFPIMTDES